MDVTVKDILPTDFSDIMRQSYLDYAMSVIGGRAMPDIRDGLKVVQRRIIYSMLELGNYPDKPHRKCARIVGDTMGKYHPHGDSSIYEALVNLARDWKAESPLVDGHGNFGSLEGDGAAAMRYTEARLTEQAMLFLQDIEKGVVNFVPNFDGTEKEPEVLPVQYPNLLVNGSEGIAVGIATKIPTHNLGEVIDGTIAYLKNNDVSVAELMEYIPGPDFATGGMIVNPDEIKELYQTGRGKLRVRGKAEIVHEKGHDVIVITEIPPSMTGSIPEFIRKISELYQNKQLPDVTDVSNMTGETPDIRVHIKRGGDAENTLNILYKKAGLESTFGAIMIAVDATGNPIQFSLKEAIAAWVDFNYEVQGRKYSYLKKKEEDGLEVKEGLIKAVDCIDLIIEILRGSKTVAMAKKCLVSGDTRNIKFKHKTSEEDAKKLTFTERQADAILAMRLSRLIGLELLELQKERDQAIRNIKRYTELLESPVKMRNQVIKDLENVKATHAVPRRTIIRHMEDVVIKKAELKEIPVAILIDRFGYIKCVEEEAFKKSTQTDTMYKHVIYTNNMDSLYIFTDKANVHQIRLADVPLSKMRDKGVPLENISNFSAEEQMIYLTTKNTIGRLVFVSSDGFVKIVDGAEFHSSRKTMIATKLTEGESLVYIGESNNDLVIATSKGYFIRVKQDEIPSYKKIAVGCKGIALIDSDRVLVAKSGTTQDVISYKDKEIEFLKIKPLKRGAKGTKMRI